MSTDPTGAPGAGGGVGDAPPEPSEEDRLRAQRAAYEAELSRITAADMMLQAAVSLLNIGGHRLAPRGPQPPDATGAPPVAESDLEQVRDAIDGVRALLEILERRLPSELGPLRDALSQLQMAYAREVQASGADARPGGAAPAGEPQGEPGDAGGGKQGQGEGADEQPPPGPGPAESSGRLWVPGR
ncbi:MAG TPA: hypothetical protein VK538_04115 [Solirubrobacteraceae bacterium]|nr:hypothetical protein [Solirubrobacteraceae bacterium]